MVEKCTAQIREAKIWRIVYILALGLWILARTVDRINFVQEPEFVRMFYRVQIWVDQMVVRLFCLREIYLFLDKTWLFLRGRGGLASLLWDGVHVLLIAALTYVYGYFERGWMVFPLVYFAGVLRFDDYIKVFAISRIVGIIAWIGSYLLGIAQDVVFEFDYAACHSMGTFNPNTSTCLLVFTFFALWYLYGQERKALFTLLAAGLAGVCWYPFGARTQVMVLLIFICGLWVLPFYRNSRGKLRKALDWIFILSPILLTVFSFALGAFLYFVRNPLTDSHITTRFLEAVYGYQAIGIHWMGSDLGSLGRLFYLDNMYVSLVYKEGLLFAGAAMVLMVLTNMRIVRDHREGMLLMAACLYVMCVMESLFSIGVMVMLVPYYFSRREVSNVS